MKVNHSNQIEAANVQMQGAEGCRVRWLIDDADGAPHFAMREFTVGPSEPASLSRYVPSSA
jgi:hypothetical protein